MKKRVVFLCFMAVMFFLAISPVFAVDPIIKPADVCVYLESLSNEVGTFQGLEVQTRITDDEMFKFDYFISLKDLTAVGKKFKKSVVFDEGEKKLTIGKKTLEVVPLEISESMNYLVDQINVVEYKGQFYFDLRYTGEGFGFDSVCKMGDGIMYKSPLKE
ncbi:MAG: hypothetical protein LWY06_19515 [Firmicutes bacterium]|nr:hypothetical protein [Bacillota bacterium]